MILIEKLALYCVALGFWVVFCLFLFYWVGGLAGELYLSWRVTQDGLLFKFRRPQVLLYQDCVQSQACQEGYELGLFWIGAVLGSTCLTAKILLEEFNIKLGGFHQSFSLFMVASAGVILYGGFKRYFVMEKNRLPFAELNGQVESPNMTPSKQDFEIYLTLKKLSKESTSREPTEQAIKEVARRFDLAPEEIEEKSLSVMNWQEDIDTSID